MTLRPATRNDWQLLLDWRNDKETRHNSHHTDVITPDAHRAWLVSVIESDTRHLYILEDNGVPVATGRADYEGTCYELSWTVSPQHRGKGYAKELVKQMAALHRPVRAEIKEGNTASVKIAEGIGLRLDKTVKGVHFYK